MPRFNKAFSEALQDKSAQPEMSKEAGKPAASNPAGRIMQARFRTLFTALNKATEACRTRIW